MMIALSTDEWHPIHNYVEEWLHKHGYQTKSFGAYLSHHDTSWVDSTTQAAKSIANGTCDKGILCCWSGTGASIAANKVPGIRAALCWDSETVELAAIWNHANVLILPNRILTPELVDCMLEAWFKSYDLETGLSEVQKLENL